MLKRWMGWTALMITLLLGGCATTPPQEPIALAPNWADAAKSGRVGVMVSAIPKPDTEFPGADCLLCLGVASAMHSSLTTHVRTLSADELKPLQADLVALLKSQGIDAVAIDAPAKLSDLPEPKTTEKQNMAPRDFSAFQGPNKLARLLVVDVGSVGIWRNFASYVPTEPPRAVVNGRAYLVDLSSHRLEWLHKLEVRRAAEGAWDEAPKFPGLTNAYFQALDAAMEEVKKPFAKR